MQDHILDEYPTAGKQDPLQTCYKALMVGLRDTKKGL